MENLVSSGNLNLSITPISEDDLDTLRRLYLQVRKRSFDWLDDATLNEASFDKDTEGEYILVAKMGNEVVGFVSAWVSDNFIHHLFIQNEHQNKGIGTLLLNIMILELRAPVTLKCLTRNVSAIRFYLRNGWIPKSGGVSGDGAFVLFEHVR